MKLISGAVGLMLVLNGCGRSLLIRQRPAAETRSQIPGIKYKTLGTLAASDDKAARRVSANLRADLAKLGINAVSSPGRWDTEKQAYEEICTKKTEPVDGVLLVSYSDLTVIDCETQQVAFTVDADPSDGGPGIREMTRRLVRYLQGAPAPTKDS